MADAVLAPQSVDRLILAMNGRFPAASVDGYQMLIPSLTNPPKDRHVLAAAVLAKADLVVTFNLKDFRIHQLAQHRMRAQSPDDFLTEFAILSFAETRAALDLQVSPLRRPPMSIRDVLDHLETSVPTFARSMRDGMLANDL